MHRGLNAAAVIIPLVVSACLARGPVVDTGSKPENVGGTIAGIVRAAGSGQPLSGRKVTAVELSSGRRYSTSTATNGGYTIKVPTGRYRLELELREGEGLAEQPADTDINTSDLDADRDFVVTVRTASARAPRFDSRAADA